MVSARVSRRGARAEFPPVLRSLSPAQVAAGPLAARFLAALRQRGLERESGETLRELACRGVQVLGPEFSDLPGWVEVYYASRYGDRPPELAASRLDSHERQLESSPRTG